MNRERTKSSSVRHRLEKQRRRNLIDRKAFGLILMTAGICLLFPLAVCLFDPSCLKEVWAFAISGSLALLCGWLFARRDNSHPLAEGWQNVTVLLGWCAGIFFGALPFAWLLPVRWIDALFESVSGWTTTGLSTLDVSAMSSMMLFYRALIQFAGGLGFLMVIVMFVRSHQAAALYRAEGHSDWLIHDLQKTALSIAKIYLLFFILGTIAYLFCGQTLLDAVCNTMCALSTGGFSNHPESMGYYHSAAVNWVTIVLMLLGTTNFAILDLLLRGRWKKLYRLTELRTLFLVLLFSIPAGTLILKASGTAQSFTTASFELISALSTCGFSTVSYTAWPGSLLILMIVLMIFGGGMGSTAGGIKLARIAIAGKTVLLEFKKRVRPILQVSEVSYTGPEGKTTLKPDVLSAAAAFIFLYLFLLALGTFGLCISAGCTLQEGLFEFASSLGTVGLSIGITGPSASVWTLLIEIFGMLCGRMELFLVFSAGYSLIHAGKQCLQAVL